MKTEELTALGLTEEQTAGVFKLNGLDVEAGKKRIAELEGEVGKLTTERDDLNTRLTAANETLAGFEGIDPAAIKGEVEKYKKAAEAAEKSYTAKILERDQQDWLNKRLDDYGVKSPYARRQLIADAMAEGSGLSWKEGAFFGFDDYMKSAKEKDASLYMTAEEKEAAEKQAQNQGRQPSFVGPSNDGTQGGKKYTPPKIF